MTKLFQRSPDAKLFPKGTVIVREREPGDRMYVVTEGEVEIKIGDQVLERVRAEGFFGEMSLADHEPRSATAVAATDVRAVEIDEKVFLRLVQQTPGFALEVIRTLAARLRTMDARV